MTQCDPLFVRVVVKNPGSEPVSFPKHVDPKRLTLTLLLSWSDSDATLESPRLGLGPLCIEPASPLLPGRARTLYYRDVGSVPPLEFVCPEWNPRFEDADDEYDGFWDNPGQEFRVTAQVPLHPEMWLSPSYRRNGGIVPSATDPFAALVAASSPIRVKPRSAEELAMLTKLWGTPADRKRRGRNPGWLFTWAAYVAMVPEGCNSREDLLTLERSLARGTRRDTVFLARMVRIIETEGDQTKRSGTINELMTWLDTLPDVERHCLALEMASWLPTANCARRIVFDLAYGISDRMPAKYYSQGYREFYLRKFGESNAGFGVYLKKRGESYPWIERLP
jgi:hypothetical protein